MSEFYEKLRAKKAGTYQEPQKQHERRRTKTTFVQAPEEAKPVIGFENYLITDNGEIYNTNTSKYMSQHTDKQGYLYVMLTNSKGQLCHKKVHIAVAEVYVPNPDNLPIVNHLDGNKQNPYFTNLEWDTLSGNTQHAYDTGLIQKNWKPITRYDLKTGEETYYRCVTEAVDATPGATQSGISKACNGHIINHARYGWRYTPNET